MNKYLFVFFILCLFIHMFTQTCVTFLTLFLSTVEFLYSETKKVASLYLLFTVIRLVCPRNMLRRAV